MHAPDSPSGRLAGAEFLLRNGLRVLLRPSCGADAPQVAEAMRTASPTTLRNRFFVAVRSLPEAELRERLEVRSPDECCLVAVLKPQIIGGVRFVRRSDPEEAELAITVHDAFQRQGLGSELMRRLIPIARERGIRRLVGETLNDNQGLVALLGRFGPLRLTRKEPGIRHVELDLEPEGR